MVKRVNGKKVGVERKTKRIHVKTIHLNGQGAMERVSLSDGSELVGIVGGGMQQNGAKDEASGQTLDLLQLTMVGKFEIDKPEIIEVQRSPIVGHDGRPL